MSSPYVKELAPNEAMRKLWSIEEQFRNRVMSAELALKRWQVDHARILAACKANEDRISGIVALRLGYEESTDHRTNMMTRRIIQDDAEAFAQENESASG
jgi:hypothetical protein